MNRNVFMKRNMVLLLGIAVFSAGGSAVFAETAEDAGEKQGIEILFTSDVHCGIDQNWGYGGLQQVRDAMEEDGKYVFLVDNGDSIQGESIGTVTDGEAIIDLMNQIGYDAAIPGNHEFDYGMEQFLALTEQADFPYISCNFNKSGEPVFEPYIIKEAGDVKIAFVGVTTPKTLTSSTPKYFQDEDGNFIYGFLQDDTGEGVYNAVQEAVDTARNEGADYVVVMGHVGNEAECIPWTYADIIENTNGIDVFLDGHSHDTDKVVMLNKDGEEVIRQACGTKLSGIGYVEIDPEEETLDTGLLVWNNDISYPDAVNLDNEMVEAVAEASDELKESLSEVIAYTPYDLLINDPSEIDENGRPIRLIRRMETNLGDLVADAFLVQSEADIAMVNGGGIRADIPAGDITIDNVLATSPFGNMLTVVEATGQQILDALEWGSRVAPEESGAFPQVAGLTYEIRTYQDSACTEDGDGMFTGVDGEYRVQNVMINGEPLDTEKTYKVAGSEYVLLENGDGYTMFDGCNVVMEAVMLDNQVLMNYISDTLGGEIPADYEDPYGQDRIVELEE